MTCWMRLCRICISFDWILKGERVPKCLAARGKWWSIKTVSSLSVNSRSAVFVFGTMDTECAVQNFLVYIDSSQVMSLEEMERELEGRWMIRQYNLQRGGSTLIKDSGSLSVEELSSTVVTMSVVNGRFGCC